MQINHHLGLKKEIVNLLFFLLIRVRVYSSMVITKIKETPQSLFYDIILSCKIVDSD